MQYGSFYGGKPGIAPIIVKHFDSINAMTTQFSRGGNFNEVGYGQYVIIDTAINGDYSNPQNGIVYRRGFNYSQTIKAKPTAPNRSDYTSESAYKAAYNNWLTVTFKTYADAPGAGAQYVGKIVGPEGETAALEFQNYNNMTVPPNKAGAFQSLGPGDSDNDEVKYKYINVLDSNNNITTYKLGIAIPGYNLKISAEPDSPYIADGTELATKDKAGNFYSEWNIKVPRGKHGDDADIYIKDGNDHHDIDDSHCDDQHLWKKIISYENSTPSETWTKLEPYKVIKNISDNSVKSGQRPLANLDPNNNIIVGVKYNGPTGFPNDLCLLCIKGGAGTGGSASVFSGKGEGFQAFYGEAKLRVVKKTDIPASAVTVDYTQDDDQSFSIRLLDDIQLDDNGQLYAKYTDINNRLRLGTIQDILDVAFLLNTNEITSSINKSISKFYVTYNTELPLTEQKKDFYYQNGVLKYPNTDKNGKRIEWLDSVIKYVNGISWNNTSGDVTVTYSDGTTQALINSLKGLTKAQLDQNRYIKLTWNTNNQTTTLTGAKLRDINDVYIQNEGDLGKEQSFHVNYKVGAKQSDGTPSVNGIGDDESISDPLNYIVDAKLNGDNLCVLWSSPSYRNSLTNYYNLFYKGTKYRYQNLGPILSGEHIIGNFPSLAALQAAYPNGFGADSTTTNRAGWVATVKETDSTTGVVTTKLYAYDYINPNNGWYQIYNMTDSAVNPQTVMMVDSEDANRMPSDYTKHSKLQPGGYWFVKFNEGQDLEYDIAPQQSITNLFTT